MEVVAVWKAVLAELELSVSSVYFSTWIKPLSIASLESLGGETQLATIMCPSSYHQNMIEQRYQGQIQRSIERVTTTKTELAYTIGRDETTPSTRPAPLFQQDVQPLRGEGTHNLNPRLTFDTYIVGSSNNFAHAAAQGVAKSPGTRYNPLFIYGGVGLGKTHLMHAVGHAIYRDHPDWTILYISAETFANDLIASLQNKRTGAFKKKYRSAHVLLVDDIQFISGKEFTQEEFFHTFNELHMAERQIILSSDRPPQEIAKIEERLSSRFMGGLTVDIQAPDFEMRVAILTQKCHDLNLTIPAEAISLIAERPSTNIRELEGLFRGVLAKADTSGGEITAELVREFFGLEKERRTQRLRPNNVISKTAQYFDYKSSDLTGNSRKAPLVNARHIAMYLIKSELGAPHEQVGELFGGRDHTTVMHAVEKVEKLLTTDPELGRVVADIKHLLWKS
jgi:chromosomal replication initiator protein